MMTLLDFDEFGRDIEFNSDGSAMFILIMSNDKEQKYIYQFRFNHKL